MSVYDEFKNERQKVKEGPFLQRVAYFWDYYKWHTIISIILVVGVVYFVYTMITKTDCALSGVMLNSFAHETEKVNEVMQDYIELKELDTDEYHVSFSTNLSYSADDESGTSAQMNFATDQTITARNAANDLDFITGDLETMASYAYRGMFLDLRNVLSAEQVTFYEPYFLYIDQAVLEQRRQASDSLNSTEAFNAIVYPNCTDPESMENPIPVMIDVRQCKPLTDIYTYEEVYSTLAFGFCSNAARLDNTVDFLNLVMEYVE